MRFAGLRAEKHSAPSPRTPPLAYLWLGPEEPGSIALHCDTAIHTSVGAGASRGECVGRQSWSCCPWLRGGSLALCTALHGSVCTLQRASRAAPRASRPQAARCLPTPFSSPHSTVTVWISCCFTSRALLRLHPRERRGHRVVSFMRGLV